MAESWGTKISQAGVSVLDAADWQTVMSSGWPLLKIAKAGVIDGTNQMAHGLGYNPMFWVFNPAVNTSDVFSNGSFQYGSADATNIYGTAGLYVYVFAMNLLSPFEAETINLQPDHPTVVDHDWGLKLTKEGVDATTATMLKDYVVHSNSRSPLVHSVQPKSMTYDGSPGFFTNFTITHNLGYVPLAFCFASYNDGFGGTLAANRYYTIAGSAGAGGSKFNVTDHDITYTGDFFGRTSATDNFTIVILKDPFSLGQSITAVTY